MTGKTVYEWMNRGPNGTEWGVKATQAVCPDVLVAQVFLQNTLNVQ